MSRAAELKKITLSIVAILVTTTVFSQLVFNNTYTAQQYVEEVLLGKGVTVSNVTFTGNLSQIAEYSSNNTDLDISYGLIMASGNHANAQGPNNSGSAGNNVGGGGDPDLDVLTSNTTFDAFILEFDFVPNGDTIRFNYIFASEEYSEYVDAGVNDGFGFFVSGPGVTGTFTNNAKNIALIPNTTNYVEIDAVNNGFAFSGPPTGPCTNCQYWEYTGDGAEAPWNTSNFYTQYDGHTTVLEAKCPVMCDSTYHIKLAIADAGDGIFDSGVFFEGKSFGTKTVDINVTTATGDTTIIEGCTDATFEFIRPDTIGDAWIKIEVGGTATEGTDYNNIPDSIFFPAGSDTVTLNIFGPLDTINEGSETIIITVYTITSCGDTIPEVAIIYLLDNLPLELVSTNDTILCPGDSITIFTSSTNGLAPYVYNWSSGHTTASFDTTITGNQTFYVTVTDSCGISMGFDTITVITNPPPLTAQSTDVTVVCAGDVANITSTPVGGTPNFTYTWSTSENTDSISVNPNSTTTYYVTIDDNCGQQTVDSITVTVPIYDPLSVGAINEVVDCPGDAALLHSLVTGGAGGYTYQWTWNNGSATTDTIITNPITTSEDYTIVVTDQCGVTSTITVTVTAPVFDPLQVETEDFLICPETPISFGAEAQGGNGSYTYTWSGSNVTQEGDSGYAAPTSPGTYEVIITDGCGNTTEGLVNVELDECEITIPNVFTPNGDGSNQFFHIINIDKYPNSQVIIYNRWGRKVYENQAYMNNWNGGGLSDGVYYYVVNLSNGEDYHGYVTLIR